jgi:hypothetical protein
MKKTRVALIVWMSAAVLGSFVAGAQEAGAQRPCSAPEHSQFDFWVGSWRVTDTEGVFQGTNRIEKILGGCALQENWTGAKGTTGHSFNIYAAGRGVWHQTWVDSNGTLLLLDGGIEGGRMVLRGQTPSAEKKGTMEHEISWERRPDGSVRQIWRVSRDGGSTWKDAFVGLYNRETE